MAAQLQNLHKKGVTFDGVIAADDTLAMSAVKYARMEGLSVPDEFSVIGYNNSMLSTCSDPELSSIDNKLETLCQHLTATLMGLLGGSEMPKSTLFSGEIVHRGTTRRPAEKA